MAEDTRRFHGAKWAQFRFGVVGPLLSSPPAKGELQTRLKELSEKSWLPPRERERVKRLACVGPPGSRTAGAARRPSLSSSAG